MSVIVYKLEMTSNRHAFLRHIYNMRQQEACIGVDHGILLQAKLEVDRSNSNS